jgi:hypothetical protein
MDKDEKINSYFDCKEEVRELERLLHEARLRYRSRAKRLEKQSFSDYLREWYEWLINKKKYVNDQLLEVRHEKTNLIMKEETVSDFGMKSVYNLITTSEEEKEFNNGYNMYINQDQDEYGYCETDEI